jgi:hypothetical protein
MSQKVNGKRMNLSLDCTICACREFVKSNIKNVEWLHLKVSEYD